MTPFLRGFVEELALTKVAGILGGAAKFVAKHPMATLGGGAVLGMTGYQAVNAYRSGREEGSKPKYLAASANQPSDAAFTNYHGLFNHELPEAQKKKLSENAKPELMRR